MHALKNIWKRGEKKGSKIFVCLRVCLRVCLTATATKCFRMCSTMVEKSIVERKGEINGARYKNYSVPENRAASISYGNYRANAMIFSTIFEHLVIEASTSIEATSKNPCFHSKGKSTQTLRKLFGPRKPRCVDFMMQTYSKRYDFFDRFRSFSSIAIDRGIGIGRFGVEKTTFDFLKKT